MNGMIIYYNADKEDAVNHVFLEDMKHVLQHVATGIEKMDFGGTSHLLRSS